MPSAKQKPTNTTSLPIPSDLPAELIRRLEHIETLVTPKGFPKLSPWWRETLIEFALSKKRQLVIRVGRRGGKSSSLCRFAVAYALWFATLKRIPPGDVGYVIFVSARRKEANARLRTIKALLDACNVPYEENAEFITLQGFNVGFCVQACSVGAVSGWTSILVVCDEVAKWLDEDSGANPADEVLAAVRPTGATTKAPIILSSSPVTFDDAHAREFDKGTDDFQLAVCAPTWVANPTVTKEDTRQMEQDERVWKREFAAIPQPAVLDGYLADVVGPCVDAGRDTARPRDLAAQYIIALDPAWRRDEFAVAVLKPELRNRAPHVAVEEVLGWRAKPGTVLSVDNVVAKIADICTRWGTKTVYSDQKDVDTLRALLDRHNITLIGVPWTASNKTAKFRLFRSLCMDRRVDLPNDPVLIKQLESICIRLTPSGTETYVGKGSDDRAFAVVLGAAEAVSLVPVLNDVPDPDYGPTFESQSLDLQ